MTDRLRIVVHDYGGYPFIVQLSRELAQRGHDVLHLFADGFRQPKGPMGTLPTDAKSLSIEPVELNETIRRGGFGRITQERRYGKLLASRISAFAPDLVVSANSPLDVQVAAMRTRGIGAAFVFWLQDLHSVAITRIIGRRRGRLVGAFVGARFARLEHRLLLESDAVIAISTDHLSFLQRSGVPDDRVDVIENWAPLDETPVALTGDWSLEHGIRASHVILYAGTLALKHNPSLLLELARGIPEAAVVVVADGPGADWLEASGKAVANLVVLPLQPYETVPAMLSAADLSVVVLEPDASSYSVPSKVLTYLAAGKAILAAIPAENSAAKLIMRTGAGVVVDPQDVAGMLAAARRLLADPEELRRYGEAGRTYARENFDIDRITSRFEATFYRAVNRKSHSGSSVDVDTGEAVDTSHEAST